MPPTDCHESLQGHLESLSKMTAKERRLLAFYQTTPRTAREKRVHARRKERIESNVRTELFQSGAMAAVTTSATTLTAVTAMAVGIDWSAIDWAAILKVILPILIQIIMLFFGL